MKLNWAERLIVNNPVRVLIQRLILKWIGQSLAPDPAAKILEVGCGRGAGACLLLEKFQPARLHAMDLDRKMIRQALAYLNPEQQERISLYVGDVFRLPYRDGTLDGVFGFGVLHHLPDWRRDQLSLRYAVSIPTSDIWVAHVEAKRTLVEHVNRESNAGFDRDVLTIGFARRFAAYKRAGLIFRDLDRLKKINREDLRHRMDQYKKMLTF